MPLLTRTLRAAWKHDDVIEKLRRMYITQPMKPKLSHKHLAGKELDDAVSVFKHFDKNKDKVLNQPEFNEYVKWNTNYGINLNRIDDVRIFPLIFKRLLIKSVCANLMCENE